MYIIVHEDQKQTELDRALSVEGVRRQYGKADADELLAEMELNRRLTDDAAKITNTGRKAGWTEGKDPGWKVIARIPERAMIEALAVDPEFLRDGKTVRRTIRKHSHLRAHTGPSLYHR